MIECREIGAIKDIKIKTLPCRVQKMEHVAPDVMIIYLKLPANERLQFLAGQYIDILMKDGKRRSFSLANAPHDDELLQLHVRNYRGGTFAEHVFTRMKERDILRFEGPLGTFFLREDSDKPIVFVASGTGFAPVKGILEHVFHIKNTRGSARKMVLYWGNRTKADLYMANLAESWQREHDNFTFIPVLSEALPADDWNGRNGLVHQAVLQDFSDLSGHQVYACGAPAMVEAAHRDFTSLRGLAGRRILFRCVYRFPGESWRRKALIFIREFSLRPTRRKPYSIGALSVRMRVPYACAPALTFPISSRQVQQSLVVMLFCQFGPADLLV